MARKRAENREGSLGFPGVVKPVFTKDSKTPREKEKITRAPRERETRTHLKKLDIWIQERSPVLCREKCDFDPKSVGFILFSFSKQQKVMYAEIMRNFRWKAFKKRLENNIDRRCRQPGIYRVQCIGAGGRNPFWHGRRVGSRLAKSVEVYSQKVMSGESRGLSVETNRLSAWLFGRLSHCRGSQHNMGSTVRPQSSHMNDDAEDSKRSVYTGVAI
ncbi:hypothetical protein TNCV_2344091 [Trichonephila clavipes]|nr:hypothetical protein TNCV_2344091 [Trichonephila clavipes]